MHLLLKFLGTLAAVYLTVNLIPGVEIAGGWTTILLLALVWSVIVMVIRPALRILTFPITLITFGLFSVVLNTFLFYAMQWVVPGFTVAGLLSAIVGAFVLSLLTWLIQKTL